MPTSILVSEFIHETNDDYNSPITSSFGTRISECKSMIANHEEALDFDRDGLTKMKKAIKAILTSGTTHFENEMYLATALEKIGDNACAKDPEVDIGAAFIKFAVVTKELSALMKTLMQNLNNIVMFPLDNLLKGDLRGVKGDLKRPFDKASKDYDSKFFKIEKEKKQQSKEAGFIRSEVQGSEIAEEMEKERRMFQLQMCEYLIKFNEIKTKKGIDLIQNLVEYYHAQTNYFQDGLKTIEHFGNYVAALSVKLQKIRQSQDEERRQLSDLRTLLVRSTPGLDKDSALSNTGTMVGGGLGVSGGASVVGVGGAGGTLDQRTAAGYSLHQLQGDKHHGVTRAGHLLKKSDGKMRRVWQKRRCRVQAEGYLEICHADETKPPTRVNLLTCQIKPVTDDKRGFDLLSYNRTYHFQAEDEQDAHAWMSVLVNCKEMALKKAFDDSGKRLGGGPGGGPNSHSVNHSLIELQQSIIRHIQRIPGNDHCCDCNSQNDATWLSTNFGIIVCIECSGVHRDLGVHISRIQSLVLDNVGTSQLLLARYMTNQQFNDIMEAKLPHGNKPTPSDSMEIRFNFIRAKYVDKKYAQKTCHSEQEKLYDLEVAISNSDLGQLLQTFAENVELSATLPSSECNETALHRAVMRSNSKNLYIVDFLVQNMSPHGIDRQTAPLTAVNNVVAGCNTALHLCAMYDKIECMKLLLRSGADTNIRNSQDKTPLEIAHDMEFHTGVELLQNAAVRQKSLFDNINTDWNLLHDDGSTDFSDDDTIVDDRNGSLTPEKKNRSRPPSYTGGDSPVTIRSRSSTCDSLQSGNVGSLKKRTAPLPPCGSTVASSVAPPAPLMYGTLPTGHSHSRTPSDSMGGGVGLGVPLPGAGTYHTLSHPTGGAHHKRSPSAGEQQHQQQRELMGVPANCPRSVINVGKQVMPFDAKLAEKLAHIRRPQNPPPPAPHVPSAVSMSSRLSNGRSNESISSMLSDLDMGTGSTSDLQHHIQPIPPPRRETSPPPPLNARTNTTSTFKPQPHGSAIAGPQVPPSSVVAATTYYPQQQQQMLPLRRCTALYDCDADNDDELSFKEGDVIVVTNDHTDDDNWMEGYLEARPECSGMFPIMFVHMNNTNGGAGAGSSSGSGE